MECGVRKIRPIVKFDRLQFCERSNPGSCIDKTFTNRVLISVSVEMSMRLFGGTLSFIQPMRKISSIISKRRRGLA